MFHSRMVAETTYCISLLIADESDLAFVLRISFRENVWGRETSDGSNKAECAFELCCLSVTFILRCWLRVSKKIEHICMVGWPHFGAAFWIASGPESWKLDIYRCWNEETGLPYTCRPPRSSFLYFWFAFCGHEPRLRGSLNLNISFR